MQNESLNKVQNQSESTMLLVMFIFILTFSISVMSTLYALNISDLLYDTIPENLRVIFLHPIFWLETQAYNFRVEHINNEILAYAIYSAAIIFPITLSIYITYKVGKAAATTAGSEIILKGLHVETDTEKGQFIAETQLDGADGYRIHPHIRINKEQEVAHTLIAGATRSGKSQTIAHALEDFYSSEERAVVFDLKGDLVSRMRGKKGVGIINPADTDSLYFDIAKDITSASACRILANSFLPKNPKDSQPMFADNARSILAGLLIHLCKSKPKKWDWVDFSNITNLSPTKQKILLEKTGHKDCTAAANIINIDSKSGEPSKTTASVYSSLAPAISTLNQIADWWGKAPTSNPEKLFSLKKFVANKNQKIHFIIMSAQADKMDSEYGPLYAAFYTLLINFGVQPSIPQNDGRRLHIVIDELGLFPKMALPKLLQFGGGFGLSLLAGIQEVAGLSKYSKEEITTILSNINTLCVGKLNDPETAGLFASLFGKQRTERQNIQSNQQGISTSFSAQDRDALLDSDFLNMPKATLENGYEMFLRTDSNNGSVRVKLHYPVIPRKAIAPSFISVCSDDEFSKPDISTTETPTSKKKSSSGGGGGEVNTIKKELTNTNKSKQKTSSEKNQKEVITINIHEQKTKKAATTIAVSEATDPIEEQLVEAAAEHLGAPDGTASAMEIGLQLADLMVEATVTKDAIQSSSATTTTEDSPKKRLRFRKKIIETEEEAE